MLQLGNNAAQNGTKSASVRFLETIVIEVIRRDAADDVMLQPFERWSKLDTFMKAVEMEIVFSPLFIRSVVGFMKQYV